MDVGACISSSPGVSPYSALVGASSELCFRRELEGSGVPLPAPGKSTPGEGRKPPASPAIIGEWEFGKFPN